MPKHLLITNVYSFQNKGDAAIVMALIQESRRVLKPKEIIVQTADTEDAGKYDVDSVQPTLLWVIASVVRERFLLIKVLHFFSQLGSLVTFLAIVRLSGAQLTVLLTRPLREFISTINKTDVVIACGGGYLRTADASIQATLLLLLTCLNFAVGSYLKKPVYLYSQSIGPVHSRLQDWIIRQFLNTARLIVVREEISFLYLKRLGVVSRVVQCSDAAFLLGDYERVSTSSLAEDKDADVLRVGITVRNWFRDKKRQRAYEETIANFIDDIVPKYDATVYCIPQVIARKFDDDDRSCAMRVKALLKGDEQKFVVLQEDLTPKQIIEFIRTLDIFVGTRMHSNIFALISAVPVLAIEYEHKTRGVLKSFQLEHLVIDINDIKKYEILGKFSYILENCKQLSARILATLPEIMRNGRLAMEEIAKDYSSLHE